MSAARGYRCNMTCNLNQLVSCSTMMNENSYYHGFYNISVNIGHTHFQKILLTRHLVIKNILFQVSSIGTCLYYRPIPLKCTNNSTSKGCRGMYESGKWNHKGHIMLSNKLVTWKLYLLPFWPMMKLTCGQNLIVRLLWHMKFFNDTCSITPTSASSWNHSSVFSLHRTYLALFHSSPTMVIGILNLRFLTIILSEQYSCFWKYKLSNNVTYLPITELLNVINLYLVI